MAKKHNDKAFQERLQMSFRMRLEEQFRNGIAQGMYAACKVINDRANAEGKTPEEKLQNIIDFCQTGLRVKAATKKKVPEA